MKRSHRGAGLVKPIDACRCKRVFRGPVFRTLPTTAVRQPAAQTREDVRTSGLAPQPTCCGDLSGTERAVCRTCVLPRVSASTHVKRGKRRRDTRTRRRTMKEDTVSPAVATSAELNPGGRKVETAPVQRVTETVTTCCPVPEQATCCGPAEKSSCCGTTPTATCGCQASRVASN